MTTTLLLLIFFSFTLKYLYQVLIKSNTGDINDTSKNYWMFTYDFKPQKIKNIFDKEDAILIKNKKKKNFIRVLLYLNVILLFYLLNNFLTLILIFSRGN